MLLAAWFSSPRIRYRRPRSSAKPISPKKTGTRTTSNCSDRLPRRRGRSKAKGKRQKAKGKSANGGVNEHRSAACAEEAEKPKADAPAAQLLPFAFCLLPFAFT